MSPRERWTVYPLLLLALALGARDKLIPDQDVIFRRVECQELLLNTVNAERLIHLGESQDGSGMILVYAPANRKTKSSTRGVTAERAGESPEQTGAQEPQETSMGSAAATPRITRIPVVELGSHQAEGYIRVLSDTLPSINLGHRHEQKVSGLMGIDGQGELLAKEKTFQSQYWGLLFTWDAFAGPSQEKTPAPKAEPAVQAPIP